MDKRFFDFVIASSALTILLPFFALCSVIIKLTSKGKAFFMQERIGLNGKPFKILKFRTMISTNNAISPHLTTKNDSRITPIGAFLRKRKLDELPQLINVLKGEMSLVGPRPELRRYVEMFVKDYSEILAVKPGITDYAALKFKNESDLLKSPETYEKDYIEKILPAKIRIYKEYVKIQSLKTDLHILRSTLISLLRK